MPRTAQSSTISLKQQASSSSKPQHTCACNPNEIQQKHWSTLCLLKKNIEQNRCNRRILLINPTAHCGTTSTLAQCALKQTSSAHGAWPHTQTQTHDIFLFKCGGIICGSRSTNFHVHKPTPCGSVCQLL